ncbi:C3H1-type domain-containing protein [Chloropicon primus]|uniref:C3H1-type domain-containing protein n=1 Tax=Chloropicon primus TaxID=1764295 RepID=A0A5B8MQ83_9CHLO|nr:hypothetical protein A3770_06p42830 [Chloropicon primus]UPR00986.1 C3H1-type domain-containing protein [Chloropicon primus]|eukprot:QDZ21765.1 hypothetical protein A3770_06p42830 [Chloropicon primus]
MCAMSAKESVPQDQIADMLVKLGSIHFLEAYKQANKLIEQGQTNGDLTKALEKLALRYIVDMQEKDTENSDKIQSGRLVKTRLCYHYMSYGCLRGNRCRFAHGINDLRVRQPVLNELLAKKDGGPGNEECFPVVGEGAKDNRNNKRKGKKKDSISGQGVTHILFPSELTGNLRTTFAEGEKKKYERRTMLIFQHMYVNPPGDLDNEWLSSIMKDLTFQWARSKRVGPRKRRVSDAGLTGWRLHDENRAATNLDGANHNDEPEFGLPSENQAVHERERRNSFPEVDLLCATKVDEDWEDAVKSASKMPMTPGPGIKKGSNPFAFSNKDKLSHLKKALISNAATNQNDTPIMTFAQRLKAMT